jgi:hypothetical protein
MQELIGFHMPIKKNFLLYSAIFIPVLMIIIVGIGSHLHQIDLPKERYFAYAITPDGRSCDPQFLYNTARLCKKANFFIYDFKAQSSKSASEAELKNIARQHQLISTSPDGYTVNICYNPRVTGWWNTDNNNVCLTKNSNQKKIPLSPIVYPSNFTFIGWITS